MTTGTAGCIRPVSGLYLTPKETILNEPLSRCVVVANDLGLHARSAAKIAELAKAAEAEVWLEKDGERANAASIIDMLSLACQKGTEIKLIISDKSDLGVLDEIAGLIACGFGE
jgi:phosphocarrier protein